MLQKLKRNLIISAKGLKLGEKKNKTAMEQVGSLELFKSISSRSVLS